MHVVVLGGLARVGKTDICDTIQMEGEAEGFKVKRISFASPLKEEVAKSNGYGTNWRKFKEEFPEKYRTECQNLGASKRKEDPNYWVNLWNKKLHQLQQYELKKNDPEFKEYLILVDDCRYPNELTAAKMWDAFTMFVYAGDRVSSLPEIDAPWREHESEEMSLKIEAFEDGYMDLFDWSLFNNKGTQELEKKLEERLHYILGITPNRFGEVCQCNECLAFMRDVQAEELIEQFKEALEELCKDENIPDDFKEQITDAFEDIIEDLESGRKAPMDFFRSRWWQKAFEDHGLEIEEEDDNEDSDYGHS
ncbi:MAG: hypothetical protein CMA63_06255 [Euryarchaeota archaeon]|jgi:hypothetical protein|nr:hypothetical protein [Euryarchaeota archaeon]|tara:strand:+ start:18197 stop:19117 length:921 start_codon:yes stop_codon:yes gene_type:complete